jgi:hypothetical protein
VLQLLHSKCLLAVSFNQAYPLDSTQTIFFNSARPMQSLQVLLRGEPSGHGAERRSLS